MNSEEIETFLATVQAGSMSQAASALFVSQGTVSARIMNLERKLNVKLFFRQQGIRELVLTADGQHFFQIAQQMQALNQEAEQIQKHQQFQKLHIVASDLINTFLLQAFYIQFMQRHPNVFLICQTEHSTEAHELVESQKMDIGFCFSLHSFANVIATPIYQEPLALIYDSNSAFGQSKNLSDLIPSHEIYSYMSQSVNLWHQRVFPSDSRNKIVVGTARMMINFMTDPEDWAISSQSVAKFFVTQHPRLTYIDAPRHAPGRVAFVLQHRHPRANVKPYIELFLKELKDYMTNLDMDVFS